MPFSLIPWAVTDALTDLDTTFLRTQGIELLMLDFDNTVVPYTTDIPTEKMQTWLDTVRQSGITLCVVSNSRKPRVVSFCEKNGIPCITGAGKPGRAGIRKCLRQFSAEPSRCALVGDQIYTDTLGGNLAGVHTILVRSIHNHTVWLKLRHVAELPFICLAKSRRIEL